MTAQEIKERALHLPPIERAALIEALLSSFDRPGGDEIDAAWAEEAERRIDEMDSGQVKGIPAEEVFRKIDQKR
ncbi:MAG: addiction module protein [Planctomycetaceae bacterium]|nr:addiction module protein [Planctomycetaceae bacterium]